MGRKSVNHVGEIHGRLNVIGKDSLAKYTRWICFCNNCGAITSLDRQQVQEGHCGCLSKEREPAIERETLYELFVTGGMTIKQICDETGLHRNTISKYIKEYNLTKTLKEPTKAALGTIKGFKELLEELYLKNRDSVSCIADKVGLHRNTIAHYIEEFGLKDKLQNEWDAVLSVESLRRLYVIGCLSVDDISTKYRVPPKLVSKAIKKYELEYERRMTKPWERKPLKKRGSNPKALINRKFGMLTVEKYVDGRADGKILCRCDCGNTVEVKANNLYSFNTTSCGCTKLSAGELLIEDYLKRHNIEFERQYSFEDCRNVLPLRFDFALFNSGKLVGVIEFDGLQHDGPIEIFGGEESFESLKKRDKIKDDYCKRHSIPLIRIKYKSKARIKDILDKWISELLDVHQAKLG